MSHTMNIKLELHDRDALEAACKRLGFVMIKDEFEVGSSVVKGIGIFYRGCEYPFAVVKENGRVVCDHDDDDDRYYDDYDILSELNKLKAYYGVEKAKIEARKQGYSVYEIFDKHTQEIKLQIKVK